MSLELVVPSLDHLPFYRDALERGWSPDNVNLEKTARIHLTRIAEDPAGFVASLTEPGNAPSQKVILANGGHLLGPRNKIHACGAEELLWRIAL